MKKLLKISLYYCNFQKSVLEYFRIRINVSVCPLGVHKQEVNTLPNIKSAKKRVKVTAAKSVQNQSFKTSLKTALKKFEAAVEAGDKTAAQATYTVAVSKLDKAVAKNAMHINAAARKKSQFTLKLNNM